MLIDALLRQPFLAGAGAAGVLQSSLASAGLALAVAEECSVGGRPLLGRHSDVWVLSPGVARAAFAGTFGAMSSSRELLWFRTGGVATVRRVATLWLSCHDRITSGDVAALTGMVQANASSALSSLAAAGDVVERGPGKGRSAHFVGVAGA